MSSSIHPLAFCVLALSLLVGCAQNSVENESTFSMEQIQTIPDPLELPQLEEGGTPEVNSVDDGLPKIPTLSSPSLVDQLMEEVMALPVPPELGTLDDLPDDPIESEPSNFLTAPESVADCEAMEHQVLKDLCYKQGGFAKNAPDL